MVRPSPYAPVVGRPSRFDTDEILDAAAHLIAVGGPLAATATAVGRQIGAPSGSIYHRFASRDLLVAQLWVRTVTRFQDGFEAALDLADVDEATEAAARYTPQWCRQHMDDARVLLLHHRRELAREWPDELGPEVERLTASLHGTLRRFARRRLGSASAPSVERVSFALIDVPFAAVRRHLADGHRPPSRLDDLVLVSARAVLSDGVSASTL